MQLNVDCPGRVHTYCILEKRSTSHKPVSLSKGPASLWRLHCSPQEDFQMDSNKGSTRNCLFKDSARADIVPLRLTDDCSGGRFGTMNSNIIQQNKGFNDIIVTECLTPTCEECTGSYLNKILNHRLICRCSCNHIKNELRH